MINKEMVTKVCIDDFAIKKRKSYGTVMINIDTHRIIDIINSREYKDVVTWLKFFPNLQVVSRDGSIVYSNAIKDAYPDAIQISDRFHLLKNLTTYCKDFITKHLKAKIAIKSSVLQKVKTTNVVPRDNQVLVLSDKLEKAKDLIDSGKSNTEICRLLKMDIRTFKKYFSMTDEERTKYLNKNSLKLRHEEKVTKKEQLIKKVCTMHKKGISQRAISRELGLARKTVARYLDSSVSPINGNYGATRASLLTKFYEEINQLLLEGYTSKKIGEFLRKKGYKGSDSNIRMYISHMKKLNKELSKNRNEENIEFIDRRLLIKLLYKPLEKVRKITQEQLNQVLILYPIIGTVYRLVSDFKSVLKSKFPDKLDTWIKETKKLDIREVNSFINGITRDIDAVKNAIIYDYSNGLAEGSINKIKVIKRVMYGRCSFETLRRKVLLLEKIRETN